MNKVNDFIVELFLICDIIYHEMILVKNNKVRDLSMEFAMNAELFTNFSSPQSTQLRKIYKNETWSVFMKKHLVIIVVCIIFLTTLLNTGAFSQDFDVQQGFVIEINGDITDYNSVIYNDTHYVPLRMVFEKLGAYVFFRERDCQILALSRDGDMIRHIVGSSVVSVNGIEKEAFNRSFTLNKITYIPVDMLASALCTDGILYDNQHINIQKVFFNMNYHQVVKDILDVCKSSDFHPEKFQQYIKYHGENPDRSLEDVIFRVNIGLDKPFYEDVATIKDPYLLLVLVNKYNQLPVSFTQYNLVNMNKAYTANDGKQYLLAGSAYEKYVEMADAARKEGLSMRVVSAYRTEDYQRNLYNNRVRTTGKINADNYSARPGFSEHQTGLAVDISSTKVSFEYSNEFKWLQNHAHEYGYILRYPKGKEWITGYSYEPWHYRYVGTEVAKIIHDEGITYEEFYAKYITKNEFI